ncbi:excinuclease ABC subunit UvrA [Methanobrevibacter olleyae]|uniref:Excinuclease ABC A subunit UvrA n=1 Tax=Methanobrevibacter olleyae TaxID=294671 RepID=A0A126R0R0_METOL|nr:excinuclease ABC subunit A [Methanobrevibacter olleyae]AMK15205.1 excinuclease ABC A subunit UvrA [Methanobrevibacter olleyae]SFL79292.1 excinuclease ABC subunit A [Methanobrevibacter olleyae]
MYKDAILVRGAKVHNLKDIDIDIPLGKIVAISGVSGSGKSSLALGVLYAEGSRRYLEALSTYTRRRISQSEKSNVESIQYVPAALALHQRPNVPNIRSTFGTSTELLNSLRLLYSRCGNYICPNGHVLKPSLNIAREIELECEVCGERFFGLGAEEYAFNSDGACPNCSGTGIERVIDDLTLVPDEEKTLEEGAVESWNMFGISWMYNLAYELGVRVDVPFKELSDKEKDIVYNGPSVKKYINIPSKNGKLFELNAEYRNAHKAVEEALKNAKTEKGLLRINKYLKVKECGECHGTRLNKRANSTLLGGINISQASKMTLEDLVKWIPKVINDLPNEMQEMANNIAEEFMDNANILLDLGLSYISLYRPSNTLSTGELQRVQLARTLRNPTTGVLYVLDEPSIGLHPSNVDGLIAVMKRLIEDGNSIILVDHDVRILKVADYMVELGPYAGYNGGNIIAKGKINEIISNKDSLIAKFLTNEEEIIIRNKSKKEDLFEYGSIELSTNEIHNVKPLDVKIPKGKLTVVSGVSGSGKTTLLLESLYPAVKSLINGESLPKTIKNINVEDIGKIDLIDSVPIGKNVRSTVATYSGVLDDLRKIFAKLDISKEKALKAADFSYNTGSLRCPTCNGTGNISMDVQFLADIEIVCPDCNGLRYCDDAGEIRLNNLSISDIMALTIDEAIDEFVNMEENGDKSSLDKIINKLGKLSNLGLGYLTIGEATPSLSGGEAQRLKLASEIGKSQKNSIFIFDEPSIGLHPLDVKVLLSVFQTLIDDGATVIVIEHDLDIISNADYIIDIGIDENHFGGEILAFGTLEDIIESKDSLTAKYLKELNN